MAWIAADRELLDSPGVLHLQAVLGVSKAEVIGRVIMFRWWCVDHAPDGDLRRHNDAVLGLAAGLGDAEAGRAFVEAMVGAGFLERNPYFRVRDWWSVVGQFLCAKYKHRPELWQAIRDRYVSGRIENGSKNGSRNGATEREKELESSPPVSPSQPRGSLTVVERVTGRRGTRAAEHDAAVAGAELPAALRTGRVPELWATFCAERRRGGQYLTANAVGLLVGKLGRFEPAVVESALAESVSSGYRGVFPEKHARRAAAVGGGARGGKRWA